MIRSCFAVVLLVTSLGIHRASADDVCPGVVDGICVDGVCTPLYKEYVCPLAENQCDDYLDGIADDSQYEEIFEALTETADEPSQDVADLTSGHDEVYDAEVYGVESTDANEAEILEEFASEAPAIDATAAPAIDETPAVDEYDYDEYYEYYDEAYYENYVPEPYEEAANDETANEETANEEADVIEAVEVEDTAAEAETEDSYYDDSYYDNDDYWYDEYEQYNDDSSTNATPAAETAGPAVEPTAEEADDVELYDDYGYDYGYDYDDYGRDYWNDVDNEVTEEATQEETADDRDYWSGNEEAATVENVDGQADIYDNFYEEFYYDEGYDDFWFEDHQPETQEEENLLLEETNEVVDDSVSPANIEAALPLTHAIMECIRQSSLGPVMPEWTQNAVNEEECGMPPLADAVKDEVASEPLEEEYDSWDGWDCWEDDCHREAEKKVVTQQQPVAVAKLLIDSRNQAMLTLAKMLDGASDALESASLSLTQMVGDDVSDRSIRSENHQR